MDAKEIIFAQRRGEDPDLIDDKTIFGNAVRLSRLHEIFEDFEREGGVGLFNPERLNDAGVDFLLRSVAAKFARKAYKLDSKLRDGKSVYTEFSRGGVSAPFEAGNTLFAVQEEAGKYYLRVYEDSSQTHFIPRFKIRIEPGKTLSIGRDPQKNLPGLPLDRTMSRIHTEIRLTQDKDKNVLQITDLYSRNGTRYPKDAFSSREISPRLEARGASLGNPELNYLSANLGFGIFEGNEAEAKTVLAQKLSLENLDQVGQEIYQHIQSQLPGLFEDEKTALKLLAGAVDRLNPQTLNRQAEKAAKNLIDQEFFANLPQDQKLDLQKKIQKLFAGILSGISADILEAKLESEKSQVEQAEKAFEAITQTAKDKSDLETALVQLSKARSSQRDALNQALEAKGQKIVKVNIVSDIGSLPVNKEEALEVIKEAFKAAPQDELLGRSLLTFSIFYTNSEKSRAEGVQEAVKQLRKDNPLFGPSINLKRTAKISDITRKFENILKQQKKNEAAILLVPDLNLAAGIREKPVMLHNDSDIPQDLSFVKAILSDAAVELALALKLPEDSPERAKSLADLEELGISISKDPKNQRVLISLNLQTFIQHLVQLQEAQRKVRVAA